MKLDATDLRYVTSEEFRVLTAVSSCLFQKPHEIDNRMFLDGNGIQKPRGCPTIPHRTNIGLEKWRSQQASWFPRQTEFDFKGSELQM